MCTLLMNVCILFEMSIKIRNNNNNILNGYEAKIISIITWTKKLQDGHAEPSASPGNTTSLFIKTVYQHITFDCEYLLP